MEVTNGDSIALSGTVEFQNGNEFVPSTERIVQFYEQAGTDFGHWSREMNIHLGFFRLGMNPFDRDAMFEELNLTIAERLQVKADERVLVLDLGCGFGAVGRSVARKYPAALVKGVTLSPLQVRIASELNLERGFENRIEILEQDFTHLSFADRTVDAAWAVESACYGNGSSKSDFVREAARVLKRGGQLVVVDCFGIGPNFGPVLKRCHEAACKHWAVPEMPTLQAFVQALKKHGFGNVIVEDLSWRAAISVAHAPFAVVSFVIKKLLLGESLNKESRSNLKASLLTLMIGISRRKFRYCLVTCTRT